MNYSVKEIFYTLQGEGANTGRPAVFCRFSGCNLWSGINSDRASALCSFCDTDFVGTDGIGGGRFNSATELSDRRSKVWHESGRGSRPFVVCTGGEPLLQLDSELVTALHAEGFEIAIETNGTLRPPEGIDWVCVSPKPNADLLVDAGHELKLVFPQEGVDPQRYEGLRFQHFFLQPMDGAEQKQNIDLAVRYCLRNPQWRLSLQTHKLLGLR